jgi:RNA polymerase sigma-70 factor (ECF subfamily)
VKKDRAMNEPTTVQLQGWIDRLHAGDAAARHELINCACERLRRLTRKMLKGYPRVQRWEDAEDVLQNAALRLHRALREVTPATVRDFFRLAALHVRRELLDLARHYYGPLGHGANYDSFAAGDDSQQRPCLVPDQPDSASRRPDHLAAWTEFHHQIEALPDEEREVFDLLWYQGLTQADAAAVMKVSERTVKRYWQAARLKLHQALGGELPHL